MKKKIIFFIPTYQNTKDKNGFLTLSNHQRIQNMPLSLPWGKSLQEDFRTS